MSENKSKIETVKISVLLGSGNSYPDAPYPSVELESETNGSIVIPEAIQRDGSDNR